MHAPSFRPPVKDRRHPWRRAVIGFCLGAVLASIITAAAFITYR